MVRVIVVDDEPLICHGIQKVMPWAELGCEFVGCFSNGADVLARVEELAPDLVISDIRMPKVNGLELTERLRLEFPEIRVILLTGFKNFEYAQKGIELRTVRYILKPVDHSELKNAITDAVAEIEELRKDQKELQMLQDKMADSLPLLKEKILSDLLLKRGIQKEIPQRLGVYGIDLGQFHVIGFRIDPFLALDDGFCEEDIGLLTYLIFDVIARCCADDGLCYTSFVQDRIVYTVLEQCGNNAAPLIALAQKICQLVQEENHFSISAGISGPEQLPEKLSVCRKEVEQCLSICDCLGNSSVVYYPELLAEHAVTQSCNAPMYDDVVTAVRNGVPISEKVKEFAQSLRQCAVLTVAQRVAIQCTLEICQTIQDQRGEDEELNAKSKEQVERLLRCSAIGVLTQTMESFGDWLQDFLGSKLNSHQLAVVNAAKEYIYSHCTHEVQLEEVASHIYVSKWYLSKLFKQVTGVGFNNCVAEARIECAKQLMRENPHLKNYEVAELLGFGSVRYFSQLFKKVTGMTPSEFRG